MWFIGLYIHVCGFVMSKIYTYLSKTNRSSHRMYSIRKGALRNFAKFTGKHLCQSLFFNKITAPRPATSLKKRLWLKCFPVNFAKFLRTSLFIEHLRTTASTKISILLVHERNQFPFTIAFVTNNFVWL